MEEPSAIIVDCGYQLHRLLGPGLLESVYEAVLAGMLDQRGLRVNQDLLILKTANTLARRLPRNSRK